MDKQEFMEVMHISYSTYKVDFLFEGDVFVSASPAQNFSINRKILTNMIKLALTVVGHNRKHVLPRIIFFFAADQSLPILI